MKTIGVLSTAIGLALAVAGCGGSAETVRTVTETQTSTLTLTETVTITEPAPPRQDEPTTEEAPASSEATEGAAGVGIGEPARDGTLEITVTDVQVVNSVRRENDEPPLRPQDGAQLVAVAVEFLNDGKESVDIYCDFDFGITLIDENDRRYDPVEDLDEIAGNTGCNELIQPAFSTTETLVFLTPAGDPIKQLFFWDPNDGEDAFGEESAALVDLT